MLINSKLAFCIGLCVISNLVIAKIRIMSRHYEWKIEACYSAEELQAATELYKNALGTSREISMNRARDLAGNRKIPLTTFRRHLKDNSSPIGSGRPTVLTVAEEQYLVYGLQCLADYGWGIGFDELQKTVASFVQLFNRKNPFEDGVTGHDWLHDFCHRWQNELSLRKPEYLTTVRANAVTEETHSKFMELVNNVLDYNFCLNKKYFKFVCISLICS